jgi:hypothetical protein
VDPPSDITADAPTDGRARTRSREDALLFDPAPPSPTAAQPDAKAKAEALAVITSEHAAMAVLRARVAPPSPSAAQ